MMTISDTAHERLTILADFMETFKPAWPDKFDMRPWFRERLFCGSAACAAGWATTIPQLSILGFSLMPTGGQQMTPLYGGYTGGRAVMVFFNLNEGQMDCLFGWPSNVRTETPKQWAAKCRAFLALNSPKPPKTGRPEFAKFLERTLAPTA